MKPLVRSTAIAVATLLALSACKGENKPVEVSSSKTEADKAATDKTGYPGLPTEKEQASYMIGMSMGKQLSEIKEDVNVDTLVKGLRASIAGEKLLLTEEQAKEIGEAFGQRMQAKQIAKAMAEAKANLEKGQKALAENGKKPGVQTTASGLQYQVITEGKGRKPAAGDAVKVKYKGTLLDGKEFDSTDAHGGEPAVLPLDRVRDQSRS